MDIWITGLLGLNSKRTEDTGLQENLEEAF
jgi:hypothetical protein